MDKNFNDLCYACRIGDTDNADRLISTGVNVNGLDEFDNSPLYLASFCGHEELVKLLLDRGAVCDRDRFEGARCVYGALNDSIRNILIKRYNTKAVDINQPFVMHISSLFRDPSLNTHDIQINPPKEINDDGLQLHKFLLSARSLKLRDNLSTVWNSKSKLATDIPTSVLNIITKFIYLIPVLHEISMSEYDSLIQTSLQWDLKLLAEYLDRLKDTAKPYEKSALMNEYQYRFTEDARNQLKQFVSDNILKCSIDLHSTTNFEEKLQFFENHIAHPDLLLLVENSNQAKRIYPCHLAILSRANYFKMMFTLPMKERDTYQEYKTLKDIRKLPLISLPCCEFEVIEIILRYLYHDNSEIPWQYAIDVLLMADFLLEDRMKSMAAVAMTQSEDFLEEHSIFDILYVAWETKMERLEQFAAKVIAFDLKKYSKDAELKNAITRSSQMISVREETDTIELVDDIRFYLLKKYAFEPDDIEILSEEKDTQLLKASGILEYQQDVTIIDNLLDELTLQA
ncbi:hypothetical protein ZYGR_0AK04060 [Zygosaccharomyces rouxii]|uniref:BTB domain-containing protein n=1 Tax=Zygosaccharomyces rouxii TaxID=4956 RepID=A0A1Q3ADT4_ZYGRO|nr:hypothetical protein ZYGR_0AK04060 [Zygosaccharomyces rouxii]